MIQFKAFPVQHPWTKINIDIKVLFRSQYRTTQNNSRPILPDNLHNVSKIVGLGVARSLPLISKDKKRVTISHIDD